MILVTGGSGLIGRALGLPDSVYLSRQPIEGKSCVAGDLRNGVPGLANIETVVHLAQSREYKAGPDGYEDVWAVNADATARLLEASRKGGVKHFVLASTGTGPESVYGASKVAAETVASAYRQYFAVAVIRFYAVYGPGQRPDSLVPTLIEKVRNGEPIKNGIRTKPLHVKDAARAIEDTVKHRLHGLRTASGPRLMTAHQMALDIGAAIDVRPVLVDGKPSDVFRHSDFPAAVDFRDGVRSMIEAPVSG